MTKTRKHSSTRADNSQDLRDFLISNNITLEKLKDFENYLVNLLEEIHNLYPYEIKQIEYQNPYRIQTNIELNDNVNSKDFYNYVYKKFNKENKYLGNSEIKTFVYNLLFVSKNENDTFFKTKVNPHLKLKALQEYFKLVFNISNNKSSDDYKFLIKMCNRFLLNF